jgi:hypothetical protein
MLGIEPEELIDAIFLHPPVSEAMLEPSPKATPAACVSD